MITKLVRYIFTLLCLGSLFPNISYATWNIKGSPRAVTGVLNAYLDEAELPCNTNRANRLAIQQVVRNALDALGYFAATSELEVTEEGETCTIKIALGKRSTIKTWRTEFVGAQATTPVMAQALALTHPQNSPFDPQAYAQTREGFINHLQDEGYVDAKFDVSDVAIDLASNSAEIEWRVDTGDQYIINPLIIEQDILAPELVQRFLEFEEGDYLSNTQLIQSYENLLSSDYYSRVRVTPLLASRKDGRIPVKVVAQAANKWTYLVGPGFSTDSGPRFRAEANARYLNPQGHRTSFTSLFSPVNGEVKADYRWPYGNPNHEWYNLESRITYENTDTSSSEAAAIGIRRSSRLNKHWAQTTFADYSIERFDISDQDGTSQLFIVGTNFTFTSTINSPRPRRGRRLSLDIRGAANGILSDNSFAQIRLQAKEIIPLIGQSRLLLRGEFGMTWQDKFEDLPVSVRYFTGGDKTVRGYALDSLGSLDDNGNVTGGDRLAVASAELDIPLRKNWSAALFTDAGSAYRGTAEFSQSVGVGVRWYSPLGPIRVDLAHPLDDSNQVVRIHISLGPDIL